MAVGWYSYWDIDYLGYYYNDFRRRNQHHYNVAVNYQNFELGLVYNAEYGRGLPQDSISGNGITELQPLNFSAVLNRDSPPTAAQFFYPYGGSFPLDSQDYVVLPVATIVSTSYDVPTTTPLVTGSGSNAVTGYRTATIASSPLPLSHYHDQSWLLNYINQKFEECPIMICPDVEDIRKKVEEIHMALEAGTYAYLDGSQEEPRVANLGYYVERIARVLGISVNSNGSIRSIRNRAAVPDGGTIPAGWSRGQWARNNGGSSVGQKGGQPDEERDGYAYEVRSNTLTGDPYTGKTTKIDRGGYVLVENLPQLLEVILDDLDKALGWGDAGANVLPSPDGQRQLVYQGLNTLLTENAYMLSQLSRNITGTHISSLKNQAMLQEVLVGLGLPCSLREFSISTDADPSVEASVPYPGLVKGSPSLVDLLYLVLVNLGLLVGSNLQPQENTYAD
jgi:hypothetical protein